VPVGEAGHGYVVEAEEGQRYFAKVYPRARLAHISAERLGHALALARELSGAGEDCQVVYYQPPFSFSSIFSQLRASPKVTLDLPGVGGGAAWICLVEPGKTYFLPAQH